MVAGYGWVGRGIANRLSGMGARVAVVEVDPVRAIEALMDGHQVMTAGDAAKWGEIFVTATGNLNVFREEHFRVMRDGAMLSNSGHFDAELELSALERLLKVNIKLHHEKGQVADGDIFLFNHFARFETIIPQYLIFKETGAYCRTAYPHKSTVPSCYRAATFDCCSDGRFFNVSSQIKVRCSNNTRNHGMIFRSMNRYGRMRVYLFKQAEHVCFLCVHKYMLQYFKTVFTMTGIAHKMSLFAQSINGKFFSTITAPMILLFG